MLSNRQIFENIVNKMELSNSGMESSHTWSTLAIVTPATPILYICLIIVLILTLRMIWHTRLRKWGYVISSNTFIVDENLPDFFQALKMKDKQWFKTENEYSLKTYKYMVANRQTLNIMDGYGQSPK